MDWGSLWDEGCFDLRSFRGIFHGFSVSIRMQFLDLTDFSIKFTKFEKFYDKKFEEKRVVGVRRRHYLRFEKKTRKFVKN